MAAAAVATMPVAPASPVITPGPAPDEHLLNGTWILGKVLGTGSYATVRMARHRSTGQYAVCKTTTVKASDNTKDMEIQRIRLQREVACLLHLDGHPNIVRIYDVVADLPNDTVHIVMEYVEGEELYEFLKKCPDRRANEDTVRNIARQVLNAFVYMHEKKTVLHRDIKLDNIMLGKNGQVKLIDFNLSTMFSTDPSRKLTESVGCIHYASPQILEAAHRIPYSASNGWSDVWSFGVVVFALLQGVFPFKELTPTKLHAEIQKRGGKNLTFPVPISWEAKNFITDVLDPYRRWSARELLSHPFIVGVAAPIWDEVQTPIQNSSSLAVPGEKTRSRSAPGTSMEYQQQQPQPVPQQMQQQGTRPRFQIPMPSPGPMHPSVALLKEQLPAPRTPNANMDISTMGGNYFNIQPLPTPSISQNQQSQLHYFEQPRSPHMPNGMPAVGTPSLFQGYQPPLASPAAPPFRGLQWTAHSRSRAESIQYGNSAPLETPALRQDAENPEAMAVDVLMNLDQPQMVPTPPATPNHMVDYMSPSPPEQTTSFAAPLPPNVNGHGQGMILPSPSTPGPVPVRSPGPASNEPGSSGWKNQLAALNNYSKMLMRDAAAKLASVSGEAEQIPPEPAQDAAGLTRLQKAAWKMGVHNLVN